MRRAAIVVGLAGLFAVAVGAVWAAPGAPAAGGPRALTGWSLYDRYCLACHGAAGDGRGPAAPWLWPRPRDFTRGEHKWRRTDVGSPPTADDVATAIRHGAPGTSMHGFGGWLGDTEVASLVEVVLAFGPKQPPATPAPRPRCGAPDAARGRELWQSMGCASCHGGGGAGDGPAAAALVDAQGRPAAPYDLTRHPLRRPRAPDAEVRAAIADSVAFGLAGTAMPGYRAAASAADLCAVADYVDSIRWRGAAPPRAPGPLAEAAIQSDREAPVRAGTWPGHGDDAEARIFGGVIPPQGSPPAALAPAQASLDARQCGRCHAKQVREWTGSLHAAAGSPGLLGQMVHVGDRGMAADDVGACLRCHAPLAEQSPVAPGTATDTYAANPAFSPDLRQQGVTCAACHVRGWVRHGPPRPSPSLLALPTYPAQELALHERADFCLPCHQLPARTAVAGRPLLDTYREWLEGPYMRRGVQCQHCHMPNREHTFRGVHDPETFRQGIAVTARGVRARGAVQVSARIENVGAGHMLPTTPTPAAWLTVELVDAAGVAIRGARAERRIGRHIAYRDGRWRELEDTRIPPGQHIELAAAWQRGRVADARGVRVAVRVHPDDYYEGFYRARLRGKALDPEARRLFEQALARAIAARYVAYQRVMPITAPAPPARRR